MTRSQPSPQTPFGFGLRLFAAGFLTVALAGGLATRWLAKTQQVALEDAYLRVGRLTAGQLAEQALEPLLASDADRLGALVSQVLAKDPWVVHCRVFRGERELMLERRSQEELDPLLVAQAIRDEHGQRGYVQVGLSRKRIAAVIEPWTQALESRVLLLSGVLALVLCLLLFRLGGRPVYLLSREVMRLRQGGFDEPVNYAGRGDIGRFAGTLERMRQEVVQSRAVLVERNEELRQALQAAEASDHAKAAFIASISHEIRTPLVGVLGAASLLREVGELSEAQQDLLNTLRRSADYLLTQVNDILDYSKATAGLLELQDEQVQTSLWLEASLHVLSHRFREQGLTLVLWQDPATPSHVQGDPQRLRQVLLNLLSNALKYTREGHVEVRALPTADGGVRVEVQDTGCGLPTGVAPESLFQAFTQGSPGLPGEQAGTGLGLSIAHELMERMGGQLGAEPRPDGALFWLSLRAAPNRALVEDPEQDDPLPKALRLAGQTDALRLGAERQLAAWGVLQDPAASWTLSLSELNGVLTPQRLRQALRRGVAVEPSAEQEAQPEDLAVLVADDNGVNRKILSMMLGRLGHRVTLAEDGQQAVEAFEDGDFQAVLLDYHMPNCTGPEAARRMRLFERAAGRARVPIVAVSAAVAVEEREDCLDAGMDGFLAKPFRIEDLRAMLAARLGGYPPASAA